MTLVVGASGVLGFEVCRRLREAGHAVRGLVRPGSSRESALEQIGVERCHGDVKDVGSLRTACEGQGTVISTATSTTSRRRGDTLRTVDRDGQLALVDTARAAGVRRFVFVSISPNCSSRSELVVYKREVEARVRASGMEWVVLQPSAFMEIWLSPRLGWDLAQGRARIVGAGDRPASLISVADVAAFCTSAATHDALKNRDVPLGGPEAVTPLQIVRLAEELSGRHFRVQHVPTIVLKMASVLLRPIAPIPAALIALGVDTAERGDAIDMTATARDSHIRLTPLTEYLGRVLQIPSSFKGG